METHDTILARMKNKFSSLAGFEADDASDIGIRLKVLAGEIYSLWNGMDWLKRQAFPQTALGEQLDMHALQRGLKRKQAVAASGSLTFSRKTALGYDLQIPVGTVCSVPGENPTRVITAQAAVLKTQQLSVTVPAQAQEGGQSGNAAVNAVTVMVTPPAGIESVTNSVPFSGGADGASDDELRERLLQSYAEISNGTNAQFYREYALKHDGIQSVTVKPRAEGSGTVALYLAAKGAVPNADVLSQIQTELNQLREINVDVKVYPATIVQLEIFVYIKPETNCTFDAAKQATITAVSDYFSTLSVGEPVILARVGEAILHTGMVKNYMFDAASAMDTAVKDTELAVASPIWVDELKDGVG